MGATLGKVERQQVEDYGKATSLRVWYEDWLEVEYGLTDETWAALPLDEGTQAVISRCGSDQRQRRSTRTGSFENRYEKVIAASLGAYYLL